MKVWILEERWLWNDGSYATPWLPCTASPPVVSDVIPLHHREWINKGVQPSGSHSVGRGRAAHQSEHRSVTYTRDDAWEVGEVVPVEVVDAARAKKRLAGTA